MEITEMLGHALLSDLDTQPDATWVDILEHRVNEAWDALKEVY